MKKYKIIVQGYGGEVTIGSVDEDLKECLNDTEQDLSDLVQDLENGWYEIDDQYHAYGAANDFKIIVEDEQGETLYEMTYDELSDYDLEVDYVCPEIDQEQDIVMCVSYEKGTFFEGDLEIEEDFDITKLKVEIHCEVGTDQFEVGDMLNRIYYNDEEIENWGGSTDGKSFEAYKNF